MRDAPLSADEIEARLDEALDPVLSSRRTATGLARMLAAVERGQQDFVLKWVDIIAKTNAEMAYQFAAHAPKACTLLALPAAEDWIIRAMDVYDTHGLYPGCGVFKDVAGFAAEAAAATHGAALEEISGTLELFLRGLSGRALKLEAGETTYTDTATLFLPARLTRFPDRERNLRLYKAIAAHLWAQTWYGTFRAGGAYVSLAQAARHFPDPARAVRVFHALECLRLDARLAHELPGLHRDMQALQADAGAIAYPAAWAEARARLARAEATVFDTYALLPALYAGEIPDDLCYQGTLQAERVEQAMHERMAREKEEFRQALAHLADAAQGREAAEASGEPPKFDVTRRIDPDLPNGFTFELSLDGRPIAPPAEVRALMDSILQDLGNMPDEYLVAAGDGGYRRQNPERRPEDVWKGTYHEEGAFLYNEWDHRREHYRKHWCVLREIDVHPLTDPFVARTRKKYAGLLAGLRKTFEALRGEDKLLKRQIHGDDIDFDALIEAHTDMHRGCELSERLFTKLRKMERDIAVIFMVDMSGSTKGWINDAERESLVLLCEALEILGDRYAIYGFSGMTRKRCELYRVKRFDEPYSDIVRQRITGMRPQDYTRMGVVIRHMVKLFQDVDARTKLLITLSDGKPDDYDGYRGEYGIEDTRQALLEAKHAGIHPFCITIDTEARDYLPHMYGAVNWALVDDVRKLPLKISDIYRRLTL